MNQRGKVFLHITKTAGGTLKRALTNASGMNMAFIYNNADKETLKATDLSNVDVVYGHALFGVDKEIKYGNAPHYMCFLRHPVTRTISHYYHLRNVEKGPVGDKIRQSLDINDFFENYEHWEFESFMSRIVSGFGNNKSIPEREILQKATENLIEHFGFVGFQEFFSLSIGALSKYLGANVLVEKDINIGRYDLSGVSDRTIEKIRRYNELDMSLYKFALNKYL